MTELNIRKATPADLPSILSLVQDLATFEKEPEAVTTDLAHYELNFEEGLFDAFVAESNQEIVGMCLYYPTFSTWKGKMLYLEDFIVKESHRNRGIGGQLFQCFIQTAYATGCKLAKWQVLDWNVEAIRFYEDQGATIEKGWYNGKIIF